jgi:YVTN family beta-propeller protein
VSLLAGALLVAVPAAASASATYAVTELPVAGPVTRVAADSATNTIYAATAGVGLTVMSGASGTVTAQISLPALPSAVTVDQASDTVYAIVPGTAATAYVIDGATNTVTATISLPAGLESFAAAANPVTHMVYLADPANGTVVVIDGGTDTMAATIPLATPNPDPLGIGVDTTTNTVYVSDTGNNHVTVIDGGTNSVTDQIALPSSSVPIGVAVDPAGGMVYIADEETGAISAIDTTTDVPSTLVSGMLPHPYGLALDAGSGTLYASTDASFPGTTYAIDTASGMIAAQIPRGGIFLAVAAPDGSLFAAGSAGRLNAYVTVITPSTVNSMSPVIVCCNSSLFVVGQAGQTQLTASATPAATFSATGLPGWLTFSPSGLLSGTPPTGTAGTYRIQVTADNGVAPSFTETIGVSVENPAITSADQVTFQTSVAGSFTVTATGGPAISFSETGALPAGVTFTGAGLLSGTPAPGTEGSYPIQITVTNNVASGTQAFTLIVTGPLYTPDGPVRVLDTRNGTGGISRPVGPGQTISVPVTGADGVPISGATAVVLNVTATGATASSSVTVYPDGHSRPLASSLNFSARETIPNLVVVQVGADGKVDFYNADGDVNLVADVFGYYSSSAGSGFVAAGPVRVLDTRNGTGGITGPVGPRRTIMLRVDGVDGVPASGVTAVVLNVTATGPTANSFVTIYPDTMTQPRTSNLNFSAGETIPNLVIAPVSIDGTISIFNDDGSVNLVADLTGYYTASGSAFEGTGPVRVLDTRNGTGGITGSVGPGQAISLQVTGVDGVPTSGVTAVVLNVTATGPTANSFVTVYPDGITRPLASNLNFSAGETIPNLVVVPVGTGGKIDFYNDDGKVSLVADLAGYYIN